MRRAPAQTEPHACTWLLWPTSADAAARSECETAAYALSSFETVQVLAAPDAAGDLVRLDDDVTVRAATVPDRWLGPQGPTFVIGGLGLEVLTWGGEPAQAVAPRRRKPRTSTAAALVAAQAGAGLSGARLTPGPVSTDGWGTVLATWSAVERAEPGCDRDRAQDALVDALGALVVLWLPDGLGGDEHVHPVARFATPGVVLVHDQQDPDHPDHLAGVRAREVLADARDARGRRLTLVDVPAPKRSHDDAGGRLSWSYLGHVVVNDGVVVPLCGDPRDAEVLDLYADVYPGRAVIGVDCRTLCADGHGLSCRTLAQPLPR